MVIDMLVQPMLYSEICTPGDEPDGFGFGHENLVWGIWVPWIGMSFKSRWTSVMCRRACSCRSM